MPYQGCLQGSAATAIRGSLCHDNHIQTVQKSLVVSETLPRRSLHDVAPVSPTDSLPGNSETKSCRSSTVFCRKHREQRIARSSPASKHPLELGACQQPVVTREPDSHRRRGRGTALSQADNLARPFARRAFITARPPRVLMRLRNPCARLRLRLLG